MNDINAVAIEARLVRTETTISNVEEDIKEIKTALKWLIGIVFSLNTAIIGITTKGFGVL